MGEFDNLDDDYAAAGPGADQADRCPDCGRASCTGEDCYWPDEAGITRPGHRPGVHVWGPDAPH